MKKLNLDETWDLCLQMWKWISRQQLNGDEEVEILKDAWLRDHDYDCPVFRCFFCGYNDSHGGDCPERCRSCPAVKVDPSFYCMNIEYHFEDYPRKFYAELKRLNKIRLSKKGK